MLSSTLLRSALSTLALTLMVSVASIAAYAVDAPAATKHEYPLENCPVCQKHLPEGKGEFTAMIEGRELRTCTDKCMGEVKAKPDYYKGYYDGADAAKNAYGPKGGETKKGM